MSFAATAGSAGGHVTKTPVDIRSLARTHCAAGIRALAGFAHGGDVPIKHRIVAIGMLLDRGYGKPAQPVTGEGGEGNIQVIIRNIIESVDRDRKTVTIDHDSGNGVDKLTISNDRDD